MNKKPLTSYHVGDCFIFFFWFHIFLVPYNCAVVEKKGAVVVYCKNFWGNNGVLQPEGLTEASALLWENADVIYLDIQSGTDTVEYINQIYFGMNSSIRTPPFTDWCGSMAGLITDASMQ